VAKKIKIFSNLLGLAKIESKIFIGYAHCDTQNWNVGICFMMEFVSTMFLVSMVYHTAVNSTKPNELVYGFCIAGTLGISVVTIGSVTGAALNPWRVIPSAALTGELWTAAYNQYAWIYYLGNPLAGVLIGLMWRTLFEIKAEAKPEADYE
jgi:glycerol uptake facilitator-like aquaporin